MEAKELQANALPSAKKKKDEEWKIKVAAAHLLPPLVPRCILTHKFTGERKIYTA